MSEEIKNWLNGKDYILIYRLNPQTNGVNEDLKNYVKQLQQENKKLKELLENNSKINVADHKYASEMEDEVIELTRLVSNKIMTDYDYDSVLKRQLNEERLKYTALEESKNATENILTEFEEWLEENILKMKQSGKVMKSNIFITKDLEHTLSITVLENVLDKLQELKEGKK